MLLWVVKRPDNGLLAYCWWWRRAVSDWLLGFGQDRDEPLAVEGKLL